MVNKAQLHATKPSSLPFIHLECRPNQGVNGETVVLLLPEFVSLKRNKGKGKEKKTTTTHILKSLPRNQQSV